MELSSNISKKSNNMISNNLCRNNISLDIKEKIQILHKINSYNNFHRYSFEKNNPKNKNINLLSSTLPSSVLKQNNVYKKKLIKNNTKNTPNIFIIKNSKNESKIDDNKEKIINEIKTDERLKKTIKDELKNEIIEEFLEDIANINEEKVINFLKIKNLLLSSDKLKNEIFPRLITKDNSSILSYSDIFQTSKKNNLTHSYNNKILFNSDEIEMKNDLNKKIDYNGLTPNKTIFNNLFINNNEKYVIKNPFQEHDTKNLSEIKLKNLYIKKTDEIKLSNFNFQIVNSISKNNDSFSDFDLKSNISIIENNTQKENVDNIEPKKIKFDLLIKKNSLSPNLKCEINKNEENENKMICFKHININEEIQNNIRYMENVKNNVISEKELLINNNNEKELNKNLEIKKLKQKSNYNTIKDINGKEKEKKYFKDIKDDFNNIKKINVKRNILRIEDEKRKILIKKIIEDTKHSFIEKDKKNFTYEKQLYSYNSFILNNKNDNKIESKENALNKSYNFKNNKKIDFKQFNSFSEHKERSKTFSNLYKEKNNSNIFRISHIKKILKVLKNDNNKHLLNTKWLRNISKKNIPLLCFDKK